MSHRDADDRRPDIIFTTNTDDRISWRIPEGKYIILHVEPDNEAGRIFLDSDELRDLIEVLNHELLCMEAKWKNGPLPPRITPAHPRPTATPRSE